MIELNKDYSIQKILNTKCQFCKHTLEFYQNYHKFKTINNNFVCYLNNDNILFSINLISNQFVVCNNMPPTISLYCPNKNCSIITEMNIVESIINDKSNFIINEYNINLNNHYYLTHYYKHGITASIAGNKNTQSVEIKTLDFNLNFHTVNEFKNQIESYLLF